MEQNISSISSGVQLVHPAIRRSTVGFWPAIHKPNERIYVKSARVLFCVGVWELHCTSFDSTPILNIMFSHTIGSFAKIVSEITIPALLIGVPSPSKSPDWFDFHMRPAYLARASDEWKAEMSPISATMPPAKTGPMPSMDRRMIKALGFNPLISFSMAVSISLILLLKVSIQLKELAIDAFNSS